MYVCLCALLKERAARSRVGLVSFVQRGGPHHIMQMCYFSVFKTFKIKSCDRTPLFAKMMDTGIRCFEEVGRLWPSVAGHRPICAVGAVDTLVRSTRAVQTQFFQLRRAVLLASRCIPWAGTPTFNFLRCFFLCAEFHIGGDRVRERFACCKDAAARSAAARDAGSRCAGDASVVRLEENPWRRGRSWQRRRRSCRRYVSTHFSLSTQASHPTPSHMSPQRHSIWG
jgi:hypothetical protein